MTRIWRRRHCPACCRSWASRPTSWDWWCMTTTVLIGLASLWEPIRSSIPCLKLPDQAIRPGPETMLDLLMRQLPAPIRTAKPTWKTRRRRAALSRWRITLVRTLWITRVTHPVPGPTRNRTMRLRPALSRAATPTKRTQRRQAESFLRPITLVWTKRRAGG